MQKLLFTAILISTCLVTVVAQETRVNCIIQVNNELVNGELSDIHIKFENDTKKYYIGYVPGELQIPDSVYARLLNDELGTLHFDYNTFKGNKHLLKNWKVGLASVLFEQPYLILNIYDFRDSYYKKMYSHLTEDSYIVNWNFPGAGVLIPKKK